MKCGCLGQSNLWWELEQACQEVQSASVWHANDNVSDSALGRLVEKLVEKAHHALCSFSSITFHSRKFGGQEVVKFLQVVRNRKVSNDAAHYFTLNMVFITCFLLGPT